jgi:hypothetical protein
MLPTISVTDAGRAVTTGMIDERSLVAAATTLSATLMMDSAADATSGRTEAGRPVTMGATSLVTAVITNGSEIA